MKYFLALLALTLLASATLAKEIAGQDPDVYRNFQEIVAANNYPLLEYTVETSDGYLLKVFRIPGTKGLTSSDALAQGNPAVYFQHGLLASSDCWILNDAAHAPPFMLADKGYDVWISNSRGNKYSRSNTHINPDTQKKEFFDYSFEEMGQHDVPAIIEFIRSSTGQEKIAYIGHSQGTSQMFSALTENIEWFRARINIFLAWAPVARLDHCKSGLFNLLSKDDEPIILMQDLGMDELFPANQKSYNTYSTLCYVWTEFCDFTTSLTLDEDPYVENQERLPVARSHEPSGTSLKTLLHFSQIIKNHRYAKYDYGHAQNMKIYGTSQPPEYNLSNIKNFPIALMVGTADELATVEDVKWLLGQLAGNPLSYNVYEKYGHASFIMHTTMPHMQDTYKVLAKYSPTTLNQPATLTEQPFLL